MKLSVTIIALLSLAATSSSQAQTIADSATKTIYRTTEMEAEFPGGVMALSEFFSKNLKYPKNEMEIGVSGRNEIEFVIDENGNLSHFKIIKSAGSPFDKEALRVLRKMPQWKPAMQDNKRVAMYYTLPINFSLDNDDYVYSNNAYILNAEKFHSKCSIWDQSRSYEVYAAISLEQNEFEEDLVKFFKKEKLSLATEAACMFKISADGKIKDVEVVRNNQPENSAKLVKWIESLGVKAIAEDQGVKYETELFITIGFTSDKMQSLIKKLSK